MSSQENWKSYLWLVLYVLQYVYIVYMVILSRIVCWIGNTKEAIADGIAMHMQSFSQLWKSTKHFVIFCLSKSSLELSVLQTRQEYWPTQHYWKWDSNFLKLETFEEMWSNIPIWKVIYTWFTKRRLLLPFGQSEAFPVVTSSYCVQNLLTCSINVLKVQRLSKLYTVHTEMIIYVFTISKRLQLLPHYEYWCPRYHWRRGSFVTDF